MSPQGPSCSVGWLDVDDTTRRLSFLVEASRVLAQARDLQTSLQVIRDLVVPRLADGCEVQLFQDEGSSEVPVASDLAFPLQVRGQILGMMRLDLGPSGRSLTTESREFVQELADQVALCLDNLRELHGAQSQVRRFQTLTSVSQVFEEARMELEPAIEGLARHLGDELGDSCIIGVLEQDGCYFSQVARYHANSRIDALIANTVQEGQRAEVGLTGQVIRTGEPLWMPVVSWEALQPVISEPFQPQLEALELGSLMIVPIRQGERVMGMLSLSRSQGAPPYSLADLRLAEAVADRAAMAIACSLLVKRALDHAGRMAAIQRLTWLLAEAATRDEVIAAMMQEGFISIGASHGLIVLIDDGGQAVEVLASHRIAPQMLEMADRATLDAPWPVMACARSGSPIWIPDVRAELDRFPVLRAATEAGVLGAVACQPLVFEGRVIGALGMGYAETQVFGEEERGHLATLALKFSQALGRVRLVEQDLKSRQQLEAYAKRLEVLAEASQCLAGAGFNLSETLAKVCQVVAEKIGDGCLIRLLPQEGETDVRAALAHRDADHEAFLRRLATSPAVMSQGLLAQVLETGEPLFLPSIDLEALAMTMTPDLQNELLSLRPKASIIVPLRVRGRILGTLGVHRTRCETPYSEDDLKLVKELGERAAWAIDNARLLQAEREARSRAESAVQMRDNLLAVVSHELKNPLNIVTLSGGFLNQQLQEGKGAQELSRLGNSIQQAGDRMKRIIAHLLDLARMEAGRFEVELEREEVQGMLDEALKGILPLAAARHIRVHVGPVDGEWRVLCDRVRTVQVLVNLIGNAIKFTPEGGQVKVRVERINHQARFCVRDTGPGIAEHDLPRLFERFWNGKRQPGQGTGLGLAIAKGFVEAQGGDIWVESQVGQGSCFCFTLQVAEQEAGLFDRQPRS